MNTQRQCFDFVLFFYQKRKQSLRIIHSGTHVSIKESIYIVSVLGQEKGYTVKYTSSPEGVPEGTPEGKRVYLTIYPELSPNMGNI